MIKRYFSHIDWPLLGFLAPIIIAGCVTMSSFGTDTGFFGKQIIWIGIALIVFFIASFIDVRFIKRTDVLVIGFSLCAFLLLVLFGIGHTAKGAQSWFSFGSFSFQPSDIMKIALVLILAKYFSRRHVEIAKTKHIFISGLYALIPFFLVLLQPDFGTAIIIFCIWFGMVLVSGISKRHLLAVLGAGIVSVVILWSFVFAPYQKARIMTFINPLTDIHGTGYNAYQSIIAVGSGQIIGKGIGYGTQSRLHFLPEYQTDFIFAAFAEEWGFIGVIFLFLFYGLVLWRILKIADTGAGNFETLYALGIAIFIVSHLIINIGMNIGIAPVTGITLPFMSYGGSHLIAEFLALGILMGTRRYARAVHRDDMRNEFLSFSDTR